MTRFVAHGTDATQVDRILREGLRPRAETGRSNWAHNDMESHPDHVYLTRLFAPHYGLQARDDPSDPFAVYEIDLDYCDSTQLYPDEDFLEEAMRTDEITVDGSLPADATVPSPVSAYKERTRVLRDHLAQFQSAWAQSLRRSGNCSHRGTVTAKAIRQVVVVEPSPEFCDVFESPYMGCRNVAMFGDRYRVLTDWLLGRDVGVDEYMATVNTDVTGRETAERLFAETTIHRRQNPAYAGENDN